MTRLKHTRSPLIAMTVVAALAAAPATLAASLVHPPDAMARKKKSCEGGNAGEFYRHGKYERMSSRNEDGSVDHYRRKCKNGKWGGWELTGTSGPAVSYPGTSDGSEGGPTV